MTSSNYWRIKILGRNGFSYRCIAVQVFPDEMRNPTRSDRVRSEHPWLQKVPAELRQRIYKVLRTEGIKLKQYRDGINSESRLRFGEMKKSEPSWGKVSTTK